jgi:hypothetical protein
MSSDVEVKLKLKSDLAEQTKTEVNKAVESLKKLSMSEAELAAAKAHSGNINIKWLDLESDAMKRREAAHQKWLEKLDASKVAFEKMKASSATTNNAITDGFKNMAENVGDRITSMASKVVLAWVSIHGAMKIKSMIEDSMEYGNQITNNSRKMGMSTTEYQKLSYVMKQSGSDIGSLSRAFFTMAKLAETSNTILGVSTKEANGSTKEQGKLFEELLIKISEIPNTNERAAVSMKLFGLQGKEVFGIASQGKDRIKELTEETTTYGLVLDKQTIEQLHRAEQAQTRLNTSWKVATSQILAPLTEMLGNSVLPALMTQYSKILAESLKSPQDKKNEFWIRQYKNDINDLNSEMERAEKQKKKSFNYDAEIVTIKEAENRIAELNKKIVALGGESTTTSPGALNKYEDLFDKKSSKAGAQKYDSESVMYGLRHTAIASSVYGGELDINKQAASKLSVLAGFYDTMFTMDKESTDKQLENIDERIKSYQKIKSLYQVMETPRESLKREATEDLQSVDEGVALGATTKEDALSYKQKRYALYLKNVKKLDAEDTQNKKQHTQQQIQMYSGLAQKTIGLANNITQIRSNNLATEKAKELQAVEDSNMSQKQKAKATEKINKEMAAKEKELKKEQQAWSIGQALINGAVGITNIWSEHAANPIYAAALTVLEAATMATEIAIIKSQKFAKGGIVQGTGGTDSVTAQVTPGELVMTPDQQANTLAAIARGGSSTSNSSNNTNYHMGNIIVNGNADASTVRAIRQSQVEQVKQYQAIQRAAKRLRVAA